MKICVIVAMESEYALLSQIKRENLVLSRCGIGKVNAAVKATDLIAAEKPDLVISTGVAGSTSHDVHTGAFVVGERVAYHDAWYGEGNAWGQIQGLPLYYEAPKDLVVKAEKLGARKGLIVSGDRFIDNNDEVAEIKSHFPDALAVDMESGALAQTCHIKGVPFISIRLISDGNDDAHMEAYKNFWATAGEESFKMVEAFLKEI